MALNFSIGPLAPLMSCGIETLPPPEAPAGPPFKAFDPPEPPPIARFATEARAPKGLPEPEPFEPSEPFAPCAERKEAKEVWIPPWRPSEDELPFVPAPLPRPTAPAIEALASPVTDAPLPSEEPGVGGEEVVEAFPVDDRPPDALRTPA